ncbi:ribonuclease HI [Paenibacillus cellulosilyticus]|uniref:Ribonuclease H n=1 Tax=Paenibacillus cellulosilyticus TaxID=375489 RepID=A0A2V2YSQ5_9BACL|nr:ribonuclease H family protein [Paenibacillus cellulosilyticus]PWV98639.1 ribonuclease HI [Paenibacillus cellulosilyticus]QKS43846.1 viroplasmin family protein [Paenibacillus cellulosilyticus]
MAGSKHYVVWVGRKPGVYAVWAECQKQTNGFDGAKFKSFESKAAADSAFRDGWEKHWGKSSGASKAAGAGTGAAASNRFRAAGRTSSASQDVGEVDYDSISVDVGTRGNPGPVEYKGVDTRTGEILFSVGPIAKGTNNLGEFLAIVHALRYLQERGSNRTIYSDSVNAMKWLREKKVATTLARDASTAEIWRLVDEAEAWLRTNRYENKVLKWQTKVWGEIKADYGRK